MGSFCVIASSFISVFYRHAHIIFKVLFLPNLLTKKTNPAMPTMMRIKTGLLNVVGSRSKLPLGVSLVKKRSAPPHARTRLVILGVSELN